MDNEVKKQDSPERPPNQYFRRVYSWNYGHHEGRLEINAHGGILDEKTTRSMITLLRFFADDLESQLATPAQK